VDEAATVLRAIIDGLSMQWLQESDWKGLHAVYRQTCIDSLLSYLGIKPSMSGAASVMPKRPRSSSARLPRGNAR
jgi:hypothetical protein